MKLKAPCISNPIHGALNDVIDKFFCHCHLAIPIPFPLSVTRIRKCDKDNSLCVYYIEKFRNVNVVIQNAVRGATS